MYSEGQHIIHHLRNNLVRNQVLASAALAAAIALVIAGLLHAFAGLSWWYALPGFVLVLAIDLLLQAPWKVNDDDIARFLNSRYTQLEESTQLVLQPVTSLGLLQQMQVEKISGQLQDIQKPSEFNRRLKQSFLVLLMAVGICAVIVFARPVFERNVMVQEPNKPPVATLVNTERSVPGISAAILTITPPAYTGKASRKQDKFSILAEEGALVTWNITTSIPAKQVSLLFNNKAVSTFKTADSIHWQFAKALTNSGFYQVLIDSTRSELYKAEIIADQPVSIKIVAPKQYTTIEPGQARQVSLKVLLADDYGIRNAVISATKASGKGEGVSFKEQQLSFGASFHNQHQLELGRRIDLRSLDMHPGDELYFYIKAIDNHGAESRSDMYFVSLTDTADLMSMSGLTSGVNLVPEYFRSQRQIIIDTEKLLAELKSISNEEFKNRSNNLGIDQKLLRLRYGKFLGEESETNIGEDHEDHDGGGHEEKFGDVQSIMDQYAHKHDNSEDATFFEPEQKKQLKATLTEMWNAELRLRTYKPQEALPFEYKALRLLKDLQQKSRAYVAKTAVKMPPLKPEKRLSGNLSAIVSPVTKRNAAADESRIQLQQAVGVIEGLKYGRKPGMNDKKLLYHSEKLISSNAASNPGKYLSALSAIRRIIDDTAAVQLQDIASVETALQQLIVLPASAPQSAVQVAVPGLSQLYFKNLNRRQ